MSSSLDTDPPTTTAHAQQLLRAQLAEEALEHATARLKVTQAALARMIEDKNIANNILADATSNLQGLIDERDEWAKKLHETKRLKKFAIKARDEAKAHGKSKATIEDHTRKIKEYKRTIQSIGAKIDELKLKKIPLATTRHALAAEECEGAKKFARATQKLHDTAVRDHQHAERQLASAREAMSS